MKSSKGRMWALAVVLAVLTIPGSALAQQGWSGFEQTSHTSTAPDKDGNTTETDKGSNAQGDTIESRTIKGPDGRAQSQVTTIKDKAGKVKRIINLKWGDPNKPWQLTFGYVQNCEDDQPDQVWDPKKEEWINKHDKAVQPPKENPNVIIPELKTKAGTVRVVLPSDMAVGDTISGTVLIEPSGPSDRDRAKNEAELEGTVIEVGESKAPASRGHAEWVIPAGASLVAITLLDHRGHVIATQTLPPANVCPALPVATVPAIAQSGKPLAIGGAFNGSATRTMATIGGRPSDIVAESPRSLILMNPADVIGVTRLEVQSGDTKLSSPIRNLRIRMSAPQAILVRGESARMSLTVDGLERLRDTVKLDIANGSPTVIRLRGGDMQTVLIRPDQVSGSSFTTDIEMESVSAGKYSVTASLPLRG